MSMALSQISGRYRVPSDWSRSRVYPPPCPPWSVRAVTRGGNRAPTFAAGGRRCRPSPPHHVRLLLVYQCVSDSVELFRVNTPCRCDACLASESPDCLSCANEYVCSWALLLFPRDRLSYLVDVVFNIYMTSVTYRNQWMFGFECNAIHCRSCKPIYLELLIRILYAWECCCCCNFKFSWFLCDTHLHILSSYTVRAHYVVSCLY